MLGIPLNDAVILEVEVDLTQIGPERIFGTDDLEPIPTRTARRLRTLVADVEVPLDIPPMVEFVDHSVRNDWSDILGGATRRKGPHLEWRGCPIALRFHLAGIVMVAINIPYYDGPATTHESTARVVVARRDCAPQAIGLVQQIVRRDHQPRIVIQDGPAQRIIPCSWDDLVLDPSVLSLVRDDFESFFERKRWFRKNKVAFRRGYLLYGPPGTGKTSVVRAMMSSKGLTAYTLRFFDPRKDDSDLDRLFEDAQYDCPAIILLEDIDRAFPKTGESKSNISLQQLLNCLDGIATGDGIVVVATANDPTLLDPAILKRPGRFDRVAFFGNPSNELRLQYLLKFNSAIGAEALQQPVVESEGFSFAQMREIEILAAQYAYERNGDVNAYDLLRGIRTLRQANLLASHGSTSAGFVPTRTTRVDRPR